MINQASFTLRNRNPDILTCIANLSNDEVFTPPEFANRMLDTLAEAWAVDNDGANIWADSTIKFLDPFTKSGVFLREITRRLVRGLEKEIPDLGKRVDHILTKQVYGIAHYADHQPCWRGEASIARSTPMVNTQSPRASTARPVMCGLSGWSTHGEKANAFSVVPIRQPMIAVKRRKLTLTR